MQLVQGQPSLFQPYSTVWASRQSYSHPACDLVSARQDSTQPHQQGTLAGLGLGLLSGMEGR